MSTGVEFSTSTKELGDRIAGLTLLEAKSLADYLENVHGIKPAGGAVVVAGGEPLRRQSPNRQRQSLM